MESIKQILSKLYSEHICSDDPWENGGDNDDDDDDDDDSDSDDDDFDFEPIG